MLNIEVLNETIIKQSTLAIAERPSNGGSAVKSAVYELEGPSSIVTHDDRFRTSKSRSSAVVFGNCRCISDDGRAEIERRPRSRRKRSWEDLSQHRNLTPSLELHHVPDRRCRARYRVIFRLTMSQELTDARGRPDARRSS
ncbi:hypothetical protein EVAR_40254_1 [Eumeta japonica]|uniref:Uncharacterized protein n=1 Tax=Eumeta variegata TaxID=151549 RepID=A0A4C1Y469_EUMVA|nr:hypothetical protein EVAR_40254_1 [Eumeta japonica]